MEEKDGSKRNLSPDVSQSLPPQSERNTCSGDEDCSSLDEPLEEFNIGDMGLSRGEENSQVDVPMPQSTMDSMKGTDLSLDTKLCGYLLKQAGPLKAWKSRWFTYDEKKCQLFYYRTAQDLNSLGKVELCNATFSYPLKGEEGTFHIQTPERTFVLKVCLLF